MTCSSTYCFSHVPIFQSLKPEQFEQVSQMITRQVYQKGEYVAMAGDLKKCLFIIRQGRVKIVKPMLDGQEHIVRIGEAGDFFGDTTLFNDMPLTTNIEALEETHICMINGDELKALFEQNPAVLFKMATEMSRRIDVIQENISDICHRDVATRVASFLVKFSDSQPITISKKDMASYIGTTRESISRKLSDFQRAGWIKVERNGIYVEELDELNKMVEV